MNREDYVQQIKACGQSIIDNAEQIYNNFQYPTDGIQVVIEIDPRCVPVITAIKKFIPEQFILNL